MKQYQPRDKITQKMTRDGLVKVNETKQTAERISRREQDADFQKSPEQQAAQDAATFDPVTSATAPLPHAPGAAPKPDTATAERVMEHMLTNKDLPEKAKRKRKYRKVKTAKRAPRGKSIEKRPAEVEGREVFGHWEMDTVYSGKQTSKKALLVLTERKTRQEIIERMPDRTEESTIKALDRIERRFGALFRKVFKTITVDNGGEFSNVERLEQSAIRKGKRTRFYYCHPYSSFERGSNENQNRMIRRRYPKGTDFGKVSTAAIKNLEQWINNYPREILGWKTSAMCFRECLDAL